MTIRFHFVAIAIAVAFAVSMIACSEEPAATPPPVVRTIAPLSGQPGTIVTITGENFGTDKSRVFVTFPNGKEVAIESITETEISVKAPESSASGPITVEIGDHEVSTEEFAFYDLYAFGAKKNSSYRYTATVWKNGTPSAWSDQPSEIKKGVVVGTDIYAIGYVSIDYVEFPAYWKNGVMVPVADTGSKTYFTDIEVSGSDVYISGVERKDSPTYGPAKYWKNGNVVVLDPGAICGTSDIEVVGSDVYVAGCVYSSAVMWKNGVETKLPGTFLGRTVGMSVVGSDVYICGYNNFFDGTNAVMWKNGVITNLTTPTISEEDYAHSILVLGSDVYVGGGRFDDVIEARMWKNGMVSAFSKPSTSLTPLIVLDISEFKGDIFRTVGCDVFNPLSYIDKNGEVIFSVSNIEEKILNHEVVKY